jgi:myosin heavy subunit
MSQNNQTTPQGNGGKKNNSIVYWVVILVLLAACIYLFVSRKQMAADNAQSMKMEQQQYDSLKTDRNSLQSDFDAASAKIDQLVSQNSKLDSALQGDKQAMAKMQSEIRSILNNKNATQEELKKARTMINELTDKSKQMEARIAELEKENSNLTSSNKTLTNQRDSTANQNAELKKVGSVLHASNIRMEPIHKRRNGKEKETTKAKRVDEFRIIYDIDENRIAESGTKKLYLRIIAPDGNVMTNSANGSGTITSAKGAQVTYSIESDVALQTAQPVNNITVDWNQNGDYSKGTYTIEIYNEGYIVGSGTVTLK